MESRLAADREKYGLEPPGDHASAEAASRAERRPPATPPSQATGRPPRPDRSRGKGHHRQDPRGRAAKAGERLKSAEAA
ncbi:MAG: hypothetical protein WKF75_20230 [Singulisphaera sp.]